MKKLLTLVLALSLCLSLTAIAVADQNIVLKFALQNGENHPLCQSVAKFGEILSEKTNGRITLDLYYSGALGDKATTVQGMQTGTIDGAEPVLPATM